MADMRLLLIPLLALSLVQKFREQKEKARIKAEKELRDEAEYTRKMEEQAKKKGVRI